MMVILIVKTQKAKAMPEILCFLQWYIVLPCQTKYEVEITFASLSSNTFKFETIDIPRYNTGYFTRLNYLAILGG